MNKKQANEILMKLWLEKADEALQSAGLELAEKHLSFAVNRLYYSCFYAVTALLLKDGRQFSSHSAVMSEFNRNYVKTGQVESKWSKFYQKLFDDRQQGDYIPTATFEYSDTSQSLQRAKAFIGLVRNLINP